MELYERLCKNCGGDLHEIEGGKYTCSFCGSVFESKAVVDYAKEMSERFDELKLEAVSNARKNLYEAVNAEYISTQQVREYCAELKNLIPDDPQATFYEIATGNNVKQITKAIRKLKVNGDADIESIIRFLIRSLQTEFQLELNNLIARAFENTDPVKFEHYCTQLSTEAVKVDTGVYETKLPREVFVAYSSKDMNAVSELVETLEAQRLKCFVAARNLRHGKGAVENYNAAINEAMDHCRSVVFVSSTNSRSFNCDALTIELPYMQQKDTENAPAEFKNNYKAIPQQYKKPRVEYRIGESTTVNVADAISNEIFDGYERAYTPDEVAARIMKQLVAAPKAVATAAAVVTAAAPAPQPTPSAPAVESKSYDSSRENISRISIKKLKFTRSGEGYSVSSVDGCDGDIIIPEKYNGLPVISIDENAFKERQITSIRIPDTVKSIGANAFFNCCYLMKADLGNGVNTIGAHAFSFCLIVDLIIPDSVESIGKYAFWQCTKLVEIKNHSKLTISPGTAENGFVGYYAKNVITPESGESKLREVDGFVFYCDDYTNEYYCMGYYGSEPNVTLPNNVDGNTYEIWINAFRNNSKIKNITIPDSVTSIGDNAFYNCSNIEKATIPLTVISVIPKNNLKTVVITSGQSIDSSAFWGCSSLTGITIPDSVTSIGPYAFAYCSSLTGITIPDSVTSIDSSAFAGCSSLTSITIPDSVTSIGNFAFQGCSSLTSITIPDSVTSIGYATFQGCSNLTSITIPDSVTSIDSSAFNRCSSLTSITIPDSVTSIGSSAFQGCSSLTSITIPDSVTSIDSSAFSGCSSLTGITIPDSVTSIGDYAFYGCSSLTSITIPDSVTSIGENAFDGCSSLTGITIPDSVTSIGKNAFKGCSNLESITISKNVTKINSFVSIFEDSSKIRKVIFENPVGWQKAGGGLFSKIPKKILADPEKAAEALKTKYANVTIERK